MSQSNLKFRNALCLGVSLGALALSPFNVSHAQEEDESVSRLDTVTVTAQKRDQSLKDAPLAVSVISSDVVSASASQDLYDLQTSIPSLRINQLQSSQNTNFTIRGFGNGANNAGLEPSVGVFIDGVYRSRTASQIADLPNIERVEVLRGPQSTLFGKNASAGVISVITEKPKFEFASDISLTLGNYDAYTLKANITDEIIANNFAASLSGYVSKRDGYFEDPITGSSSNDRNRKGVRGQILYTNIEYAEFRVIFDYDNIEEVCCGVTNVVAGPTAPALFALGDPSVGAGDALVPNDPFSYQFTTNFSPTNDVTNKGISFHADIDLGFADLVSITSGRKTDAIDNYDIDFSRADIASKYETDRDYKTFTQEFRVTGSTEKVDWLAGLYYFDESVTQDLEFDYGSDFRAFADILSADGVTALEQSLAITSNIAPNTFFSTSQGVKEIATQENTAISLFGQADYDMTDRLTLSLGLSYTKDTKRVTMDVESTDTFAALELGGADGAAALTGATMATQFPAFYDALTGNGQAPISATTIGEILALPGGQVIYDNFVNTISTGVDALTPAQLQDPAINPFIGLQALQFSPQFLDLPNAIEDGKTDGDAVNYALKAIYKLSDNVNLYGSYATGYKAPSWNLSRDSRPFASDQAMLAAFNLLQPNQTYGTRYAGQEDAKVLEFGVKAAFDNFAFNATLFDQTIDGFQSNLFTGTGFQLANAQEQRTRGLELDGTWTPIPGLVLNGALTALDPSYEGDFCVDISGIIPPADRPQNAAYCGANELGVAPDTPTDVLNLKGQAPAGIHPVSLSVSASYKKSITPNWIASARVEYNHESEVEIQDNVPGYKRDQNLLNASFGVENADKGLKAQLWVRNALEDEFMQTLFPGVAQEFTVSGYPNAPRTFGVTVKKSF